MSRFLQDADGFNEEGEATSEQPSGVWAEIAPYGGAGASEDTARYAFWYMFLRYFVSMFVLERIRLLRYTRCSTLHAGFENVHQTLEANRCTT